MNYEEISKEIVSSLHKSYASLKNSPLDQSLRALVELRTSQINGCAYCCRIHAEEARKLNISQERLDLLVAWQTSDCFTDDEKLALQWCEAVTCMEHDLEELREQLVEQFSEREIVDLTACISIMNALNRMAVYLRELQN